MIKMARKIAEGLDNPPHREYVLKIIVVCIFLILFGLLISYLAEKWYPLLGLSVPLVFIFLIWRREYYRRPSKIQIEDGGIIAFFRYKKPIFVPWEEFEWLDAPPGDPSKLPWSYDRDGYLQLEGKTFYPLYWSVAIAVRDAYREKVGRWPKSSKQYKSSKE
jgi:hypothetical protein